MRRYLSSWIFVDGSYPQRKIRRILLHLRMHTSQNRESISFKPSISNEGRESGRKSNYWLRGMLIGFLAGLLYGIISFGSFLRGLFLIFEIPWYTFFPSIDLDYSVWLRVLIWSINGAILGTIIGTIAGVSKGKSHSSLGVIFRLLMALVIIGIIFYILLVSFMRFT